MRIQQSAMWCAILALCFLAEPTLGASNLDTRIASVLPTAQEDAWLNVGWHTNLMKARLEAQRLNRPLFVWVMNGHPMGCT